MSKTPSFDLSGRVAIVTGGSRGIGLAIAHGCAAQGAKVVIASRKADACDAAANEIRAAGGTALSVPTHMGEVDALERLVDATVAEFGGVDLLVNNAANALAQPFGEMTVEAWAKSFDVNLRGPVFLFQACLPHLLASEHAAVLNVITAGAFIPTPNEALYGAAKSALLSFTRSMAKKFAADGIRVNALAPGTVDTAMTRNLGDVAFEHMKGVSAMGRIAVPEEMAGPALLLLSNAGSYITGQCIVADGGLITAR